MNFAAILHGSAIALQTVDGIEARAGDCDVPFSVQSVSKVFSLTMGLQAIGDALWQRVGREPSGNPFINAGAIVVADVLLGLGRSSADLLAMLSGLCGEANDIDEDVAASEAETGFRNRALADFMKLSCRPRTAPQGCKARRVRRACESGVAHRLPSGCANTTPNPCGRGPVAISACAEAPDQKQGRLSLRRGR